MEAGNVQFEYLSVLNGLSWVFENSVHTLLTHVAHNRKLFLFEIKTNLIPFSNQISYTQDTI